MEQSYNAPPVPSGHGHKAGVLLAAFGSGVPAAQRSLEAFAMSVRLMFRGVPVRWAFTSTKVRTRLACDGVKTDSVRKALEKMCFERFTHVALQSLHVTPGAEFHALAEAVEAVRTGSCRPCPQISLGAPLLAHPAETDRVAAAILQTLPPMRRPQDIVVIMGHGTSHEADACYDQLADALSPQDPMLVVGTMDGARSLETVLRAMEGLPARKVWLVPLLAVAGAHVLRDMAGPGPDSWKSRLEHSGREVEVVWTGAAERPALAAIWMDHLRQAMQGLAAAE